MKKEAELMSRLQKLDLNNKVDQIRESFTKSRKSLFHAYSRINHDPSYRLM